MNVCISKCWQIIQMLAIKFSLLFLESLESVEWDRELQESAAIYIHLSNEDTVGKYGEHTLCTIHGGYAEGFSVKIQCELVSLSIVIACANIQR